MSSCCGGNCGCGADCKCNGCGGCKKYTGLSYTEETTTSTVVGVAVRKAYFQGLEMIAEEEEGVYCECEDNCTCK